ncbi:MAG: prefoldin subunit alpha [Candidatus Lokiarchaeota archaeon]|nr:prefoldin subunit alpha [Candidatus Lokiarchaeota archaeon]
MENSQNFEKELSQFRFMKEQLEFTQGQYEIFNAALSNLLMIKTTIENIRDNVEENDEILIPIGGLVSIKANIKEIKKILINVSQDTIIEKPIEESVEFIDKQIDQSREQLKLLGETIQKLELSLEGMSQSIQTKMGQK